MLSWSTSFRRRVLCETGSVLLQHLCMQSAHYCTNACNEDAIIAAVGRELWRNSRDIARELRMSRPRLPEVLRDIRFDPYRLSRSAHVSGRSSCVYIILRIVTASAHFR
jgi:hypothetical protein